METETKQEWYYDTCYWGDDKYIGMKVHIDDDDLHGTFDVNTGSQAQDKKIAARLVTAVNSHEALKKQNETLRFALINLYNTSTPNSNAGHVARERAKDAMDQPNESLRGTCMY